MLSQICATNRAQLYELFYGIEVLEHAARDDRGGLTGLMSRHA
jgi:hypothetical protein